MTYSIAIPVIAGLGVGIGFIVFFSSMMPPAFMLPNKKLISEYSELAGVELFLEKYPNAKPEVVRSPAKTFDEIVYSIERQAEQPSKISGINTLTLHINTTPNYVSLELVCEVQEDGLIGWTYVDNDSMDEAEKTCFHGDYPPVSPDFPREVTGTDG